MSVTIQKTVSGDTPESVDLNTLHRRDTGASVVLSPALPQPFTAGVGGVYTFTFADPGGDCPDGYTYAYQINWSDGSYDGPYSDVTPGGTDPGGSTGPVSISKTVTGDTPSSVQLETLNRRDNGAPVSPGGGLPQPFAAEGGGLYTFTFTDPNGACVNGYNYTYEIEWPDGSFSGPFADSTPATNVIPGTVVGPLSVAANALAQLVANVPFFQSWTGSDNATEAMDHVFVGEVGYPIVAVTIANGVLTVQTRDISRIGFGDVITIQGASVGEESGASIEGQWTVTGVTGNSFTAATTLPNLATVYPDSAFVLDTTRPLAIIGWDANDLRFESIGTGGACVVAGTLQVLIEADTPTQYANDPMNAPYDAANQYGLFMQGLNETAGTGDLMVLNGTRSITGPEFTNRVEQDDNSIRFERRRALSEVEWGLTG